MKPAPRSVHGLLQVCYGLPHCVHTAKVYPVPSPNGSTIIVCGHEQGIRILWRGGRPFKDSGPTQTTKPKVNGIDNDAIMIIDSDDEEPPAGSSNSLIDEPDFEEVEEEYDPSEPYDSIMQTLDLRLGVEVLHLSFPHLPSQLHRVNLGAMPSLLSKRIVVAVACSDLTIRIITVPLLPPSPQSKLRPCLRISDSIASAGNGLFGEHMFVVSSAVGHQSIPRGISITVTSHEPVDNQEVDEEDLGQGDVSARSQHPTRLPFITHSQSEHDGGLQIWDLLIASHSDHQSGLLLVYRIPIIGDRVGNNADSGGQIAPWRVQRLSSPAISIQFNSSLFPAKRHVQLLIAEATGVVRVFDCTSCSDLEHGSWLVSLYSGFPASTETISRRKRILAAQWASGGKAIVALFTGGEWGIWDLENAGPKIDNGVNDAQDSLHGASMTFALRGWIGNSTLAKQAVKSSSDQNESKSRLAPMTPSTRKVRQEALFVGTTAKHPDGPRRGGVCVSSIHGSMNDKVEDESLLLWYGENVLVIPCLLAYWQDKVKRGVRLFHTGGKSQPSEYNDIQSGGESWKELSLVFRHRGHKSGTEAATQPDVVVTGEHRIIIVTPPLDPPWPAPANAPTLSLPTDQHFLERGELDVNGMERILSGMAK